MTSQPEDTPLATPEQASAWTVVAVVAPVIFICALAAAIFIACLKT